MSTTQDTPETQPRRQRTVRAALWLPGLLVALGAAVATAHGLYEVARAAEAPPLIAALYPLITDGLALVAYAATARLSGSGQRYAWLVVVLAAGLSGLAQASYLAHGVAEASKTLRFGVGAWPAIAAAIVAHLLYLIADADRAPATDAAPDVQPPTTGDGAERAEEPPPVTAVASVPDERPTVQLPAVQPDVHRTSPDAVHPEAVQPEAVQASTVTQAADEQTSAVEPAPSSPVRPVRSRPAQSPARDRAEQAAQSYKAEHDELPTVARLMQLADVSRGTAGEALKALRSQPAELHIVHEPTQQESHA